jgi:hypothetical protein
MVGKGQCGEDSEGNEKDLEREKSPKVEIKEHRLETLFLTSFFPFLIWITFHFFLLSTKSLYLHVGDYFEIRSC